MYKKKKRRPRRTLTEQQKQAAKVLFDTGSVGDTAAAVGVHRTTIWRWRNTRQFQREYDRVHDKWQRDYRRERLKEIHSSPEYKREQAEKRKAKRRLKYIEQKMSEAGNSGNMREYYRMTKEYDRTFNQAYFGGLSALSFVNQSPLFTQPKKEPKQPQKPKKYIIEIIK